MHQPNSPATWASSRQARGVAMTAPTAAHTGLRIYLTQYDPGTYRADYDRCVPTDLGRDVCCAIVLTCTALGWVG